MAQPQPTAFLTYMAGLNHAELQSLANMFDHLQQVLTAPVPAQVAMVAPALPQVQSVPTAMAQPPPVAAALSAPAALSPLGGSVSTAAGASSNSMPVASTPSASLQIRPDSVGGDSSIQATPAAYVVQQRNRPSRDISEPSIIRQVSLENPFIVAGNRQSPARATSEAASRWTTVPGSTVTATPSSGNEIMHDPYDQPSDRVEGLPHADAVRALAFASDVHADVPKGHLQNRLRRALGGVKRFAKKFIPGGLTSKALRLVKHEDVEDGGPPGTPVHLNPFRLLPHAPLVLSESVIRTRLTTVSLGHMDEHQLEWNARKEAAVRRKMADGRPKGIRRWH